MSKDNRRNFTYKGVEVWPAGIFGVRQSFGMIAEYQRIGRRTYSRWWTVDLPGTSACIAATKAQVRQIIDNYTDSLKAKGTPCG